MEVKVIRSRVLEFMKERGSSKVNRGSGVTMKVMVWGKWRGNSKIQSGERTRDSRSVWLGSKGRQTEWLERHICSQS